MNAMTPDPVSGVWRQASIYVTPQTSPAAKWDFSGGTWRDARKIWRRLHTLACYVHALSMVMYYGTPSGKRHWSLGKNTEPSHPLGIRSWSQRTHQHLPIATRPQVANAREKVAGHLLTYMYKIINKNIALHPEHLWIQPIDSHTSAKH